MKQSEIILGREYAVRGRHHGIVYRVLIDKLHRITDYKGLRAVADEHYTLGKIQIGPVFIGTSLVRNSDERTTDPNFGRSLCFASRHVLSEWSTWAAERAAKEAAYAAADAENDNLIDAIATIVNDAQNEIIARGVDPELIDWPSGGYLRACKDGTYESRVPRRVSMDVELLRKLLNPALVR